MHCDYIALVVGIGGLGIIVVTLFGIKISDREADAGFAWWLIDIEYFAVLSIGISNLKSTTHFVVRKKNCLFYPMSF